MSVFTVAMASPLPNLGSAPMIELTHQKAEEFSLANLNGKVAVINFVFTRCGDRCPVLVSKLLMARGALGEQFENNVHFVSVTLDAEYDKPEVLQDWARAVGADKGGWTFLTGNPLQVYDVVELYGVLRIKRDDDNIGHNLLTTIVDRDGMIRVQYIGDRFDTNEFVADIQSLIQ